MNTVWVGDPPSCPRCNPPTYFNINRVPHRCPVCDGRGEMPHGFYSLPMGGSSTSSQPEQCRSCNGQGVIWQ